MKKNVKIIFIICIVLGILAGALNFYAGGQQEHLQEIQEQQNARKQALGQLKMAEILGTDPGDIVVPDEVELSSMDNFIMKLNDSKSLLWVLAIDFLIIGVGGIIFSGVKAKKRASGQVKQLGSSNNVIGIVIALLALCLDLAIASPVFLTASNFLNVFQQISINFVVAVGMTFVIISGGIDLSVGSNIALSGLLMGILMKNYNVSVPVTIIVCVLVSCLIGLVNGVLISLLDLPPFIATLGTMSIVRGAAYTVTGGQPIYTFPKGFTAIAGRVGGIPLYSTIIMACVMLLGWYILKYTRVGRFTYAIGGNENCAKLSGINLKKVKCFVYMFSGFCCGVAGLLLTSRLDSAVPTNADGQEMDAIAAVVIGGTSMSGGEGSMIGTLIGIFIIGIISNGLNLLGVAQGPQKMVKGLIIVIAVVIDVIRRKASESAK
ncbi:MAG: ABC transporter permease [Eubacteriales bacterium]|nr:ABC transporter permease [Eubacteriales bacterium]